MTPSAVVFAEARKRGLVPEFNEKTQSVMIDGQRWDRWYACRHIDLPGRIYIHDPNGTRVVQPGSTIDSHDEEELREHVPCLSIRKRPNHARRNRSNPRRPPQAQHGSNRGAQGARWIAALAVAAI